MVDQKFIEELRRLVKEKKAIVGTNRTLKLLKLGKIAKVVLAKNVPEDIRKDIEYYAKLANVEVIQLDVENVELGAMVGKPFKVTVIGIPK